MQEILDSGVKGALGWAVLVGVCCLLWLCLFAASRLYSTYKANPKRLFIGIFCCCASLYLVFLISAPGSNIATCILDEMPDVKSDVAAVAIYRMCAENNTAGYTKIVTGSGKRLFIGFQSEAECSAEKAKGAQSVIAAKHILRACECLYGKQEGFRHEGRDIKFVCQ